MNSGYIKTRSNSGCPKRQTRKRAVTSWDKILRNNLHGHIAEVRRVWQRANLSPKQGPPRCIFYGSTRKTAIDLSTLAIRILGDATAVDGIPMCACVRKGDRIGVGTPNGDKQHPWQHAELIDGLAWIAHLARRPPNDCPGGILYRDIQGVRIRCWVWAVMLDYIDAAQPWGVSEGKRRISIGRSAARSMFRPCW